MFSNKYSFIDDPTLLKNMKPRRHLDIPAPKSGRFNSHNFDLLVAANFGLEMMKFLPDLETSSYAGLAPYEASDSGVVEFHEQPDPETEPQYYIRHNFRNNNTTTDSGGIDPAYGEDRDPADSLFSEDWIKKYYNKYKFTGGNVGMWGPYSWGEAEGIANAEDNKFNTDRDWGVGDSWINEDGTWKPENEKGWLNLDNKNNEQAIEAAEDINLVSDAYSTWSSTVHYAYGMHHRTGNFLTSGNALWAGDGIGGQYKNIDFMPAANDWQHILQTGKNIYQVRRDGETPGFASADYMDARGDLSLDRSLSQWLKENLQGGALNNFLSKNHFVTDEALHAFGFANWSEVTNILNNVHLKGKSFYQIVIENRWQYLSSHQKEGLYLAMYEARERAFTAMRWLYGNPGEMVTAPTSALNRIQNLFKVSNPQRDYQNYDLFRFFLEIQHSFTNQIVMYYEPTAKYGLDAALNVSALDAQRMWDFSKQLNPSAFMSGDYEFGVSGGYLRKFNWFAADCDRNQNNVADECEYLDWTVFKAFGFGETYEGCRNRLRDMASDGARIFENWQAASLYGYQKNYYTVKYDEKKEKLWVDNVRSGSVTSNLSWPVPYRGSNFTDEDYVTGWVTAGSSGYQVTGFAWDRMFPEFLKDEADHIRSLGDDELRGDADYIVRRALGLDGNVIPDAVTKPDNGICHVTFASAQFFGMWPRDYRSGDYYDNNWVVHAMGNFMTQGQDVAFNKFMMRAAISRQNNAEYKSDQSDYLDQMLKVEEDQQAEAKAAQEAAAKRKAEQKKLEAKQKQQRDRLKNAGSGGNGGKISNEDWNKISPNKEAMKDAMKKFINNNYARNLGRIMSQAKKRKEQNSA